MTEAPTIPPRVTATAAALRLIEKIRKDHPEIIFHQSGGCCDGSVRSMVCPSTYRPASSTRGGIPSSY